CGEGERRATISSLFSLSERRGVVILSERAARARAKDLLVVASRVRGKRREGPACGRMVHEGEGARWTCWGAALTKKQVLRACGAQDDMLARFRWSSPPVPLSTMWRGGTKGHHFFPFFSFGATRRCHPERARGTRASEGPACGRIAREGETARRTCLRSDGA